jgi:uncharacterized protein involved in copper resistance
MNTAATKTAHDHYKAAIVLRDRILDRKVNETPVQAWAAVARECAKAESKFFAENEGRVHGRSHQAFLTNLDRVAWFARAQVETLARR